MARYSSRYSDSYYGFAPYVSVAQRRANAAKEVAKLKKKGKTITPVGITGRKIATSFWGQAWCEHLESYSDYANRLPRGRTYARNGSVVHLEIRSGEIEALVSGSSLYKISIAITPVAKAKWQALCKQCAGGIGSLVELLQAKLSDSVMTHISHRQSGLFPAPREIKMACSCPDGAGLCKHLAAVLYGVGSRFDHQPELLFQLRSVDSADLISQATDASFLQSSAPTDGSPQLDHNGLSGIFGILGGIFGGGMAVLKGRGRGDLVVEIEVETPTKLSRRQKEILEEFRATETGDECPESRGFFDKLKDVFGG